MARRTARLVSLVYLVLYICFSPVAEATKLTNFDQFWDYIAAKNRAPGWDEDEIDFKLFSTGDPLYGLVAVTEPAPPSLDGSGPSPAVKKIKIKYMGNGDDPISLIFSPDPKSPGDWIDQFNAAIRGKNLTHSLSFDDKFSSFFHNGISDNDGVSLTAPGEFILKDPELNPGGGVLVCAGGTGQGKMLALTRMIDDVMEIGGSFLTPMDEVLFQGKFAKGVSTGYRTSRKELEDTGILLPSPLDPAIFGEYPKPSAGTYLFTKTPKLNAVELHYVNERRKLETVEVILKDGKYFANGKLLTLDELGAEYKLGVNALLFRSLQSNLYGSEKEATRALAQQNLHSGAASPEDDSYHYFVVDPTHSRQFNHVTLVVKKSKNEAPVLVKTKEIALKAQKIKDIVSDPASKEFIAGGLPSPLEKAIATKYVAKNLVCPKNASDMDWFKLNFADNSIQHSGLFSDYDSEEFETVVKDTDHFAHESAKLCLKGIDSSSPLYACTENIRNYVDSLSGKSQQPIQDNVAYYNANKDILAPETFDRGLEPNDPTSPLGKLLLGLGPVDLASKTKDEINQEQNEAIAQFRTDLGDLGLNYNVSSFSSTASIAPRGKIGRIDVSVVTDACITFYQIISRDVEFPKDELAQPGDRIARLVKCIKDPKTKAPLDPPQIFGEEYIRDYQLDGSQKWRVEVRPDHAGAKACATCHTDVFIAPKPFRDPKTMKKIDLDSIAAMGKEAAKFRSKKSPQWVTRIASDKPRVPLFDAQSGRGPSFEGFSDPKLDKQRDTLLKFCLDSKDDKARYKDMMECGTCHKPGGTGNPISLGLPPIGNGTKARYFYFIFNSVYHSRSWNMMPQSRHREVLAGTKSEAEAQAEGQKLKECMLLGYYGSQIKREPEAFKNLSPELQKKVDDRIKSSGNLPFDSVMESWLREPSCKPPEKLGKK